MQVRISPVHARRHVPIDEGRVVWRVVRDFFLRERAGIHRGKAYRRDDPQQQQRIPHESSLLVILVTLT